MAPLLSAPHDALTVVLAYLDDAGALRLRATCAQLRDVVAGARLPPDGPGLPLPRNHAVHWGRACVPGGTVPYPLPQWSRGRLAPVLRLCSTDCAFAIAKAAAAIGDHDALRQLGSLPWLRPVVACHQAARENWELLAVQLASTSCSGPTIDAIGSWPWGGVAADTAAACARAIAERCARHANGAEVLRALARPPWNTGGPVPSWADPVLHDPAPLAPREGVSFLCRNDTDHAVLRELLAAFGLGAPRVLACALRDQLAVVCGKHASPEAERLLMPTSDHGSVGFARRFGLPPGCATGAELAASGLLRALAGTDARVFERTGAVLLGHPWNVPRSAAVDPALFSRSVRPVSDILALLRPPWSLCAADLVPVLPAILCAAAELGAPDDVALAGRLFTEAGAAPDTRAALRAAMQRRGNSAAAILRALLARPFLASGTDAHELGLLRECIRRADGQSVDVLLDGYGLGPTRVSAEELAELLPLLAVTYTGAAALARIRAGPLYARCRPAAVQAALVRAVRENAPNAVAELLQWSGAQPRRLEAGELLRVARTPELRECIARLEPGSVPDEVRDAFARAPTRLSSFCFESFSWPAQRVEPTTGSSTAYGFKYHTPDAPRGGFG